MIIVSPFLGALPGPGGVFVFMLGIAVLASEFDWAENVKSTILVTIPAEVKKRWRPTPAWALTFDVTSSLLLIGSAIFIWKDNYLPATSFGLGGLSLALFNRNRLQNIGDKIKNKHKR